LKWRLSVDKGRQTWRYLETKQELQQAPSQSFIEKYWLGLTRGDQEDEVAGKSSIEAARSGLRFFKQLQCDDGHWAGNLTKYHTWLMSLGEYGGPLFLIPGLVIVMYITGSAFPSGQREELVRYLHSCVNEDGGWGIHIEGESTVFGTVLNYVSLRLLGEDAETSECVKARGVIHKLGKIIEMLPFHFSLR
jgi:lanosterol synthase